MDREVYDLQEVIKTVQQELEEDVKRRKRDKSDWTIEMTNL